jgi:zinc protease
MSGCTSNLPQTPDDLDFPDLGFSPRPVETLDLENGIRLFLLEDKELPLVQVTALIGAGSISTSKEKVGFEDLFGATWRSGGAGSRSANELDEFLDYLAINMSTSMGPYSSQIDMSLRSQDLAEGVSVLADMLIRPKFTKERLELARLNSQERVRRQNDNPSSISSRLLMESLYPDNYLGYSPTQETLASISREDLVVFHQKYFAPNNVWLAVSGDFDRSQLLQELQKELGSWDVQDIPKQTIPELFKADSGKIMVVDKDLTQTTIVVGDLGVTKDHPDQYAVRVMNYILGGGGFNSRMMREIRSNRGLAYSAYSYFQVGRRLPGPFVAGTETKNESVFEVLGLIRQIMKEMQDRPVKEEELQLAKDSLINSFVFGFENPHSVVTRQMTLTFFDYPEDYLENYRANISKVTLGDIQRVARNFIGLSRQKIVLVGNLTGVSEKLGSFGLPVENVSLKNDE